MCVDYPQDHEKQEDSGFTPLSISYLVQCIRLSEIRRTIVDSLPRFLEDIEMVNY